MAKSLKLFASSSKASHAAFHERVSIGSLDPCADWVC